MESFDRASGVGGSDVAAILGHSPWRDQLDVWMEKTRHPQWVPKPETGPMRWGKLLEPIIREQASWELGIRIVERPETIWHNNGIQYAHLDGIDADDPLTIWEGKTASNKGDWEYGVPVYYVDQTQQYMAIAGALRCIVSVLLPGGDFRHYTVDADPVYQYDVEDAVLAFWTKYVEPKIPPSEVTDPLILWPAHEPESELIVADAAQEQLVLDLLGARHHKAEIEAQEAELEEIVKGMIQTAPGMVGNGWSISWKQSKPPTKVGWEQVATSLWNTLEVLRRTIPDPPEKARPHLDPGLYAVLRSLYTTTGKPARPFVVTDKRAEMGATVAPEGDQGS